MASSRHSRLSGISNIGSNSLNRRNRNRRSQAQSAEELREALERFEQVQRNQLEAEGRQLEQYIEMALRHLPSDDVIENMTDFTMKKLGLTYQLASFFRSACSSRSEIESLALKILHEVKSSAVKPTEAEMVKGYICRFSLGKCGPEAMTTLAPATFGATKLLKHVFMTDWSNDTNFTCYFKITWDYLKEVRGRLYEKLNAKIYALFENTLGGNSKYEIALTQATQDIQAKYISVETLPPDFRIDYEFGIKVCKLVGLDDILKRWAAEYGEDVPAKVIALMPMILNSRAVHKKNQSISKVATCMILTLKGNREKAKQVSMSSQSLFSQPSLFLSQIEDFGDLEEPQEDEPQCVSNGAHRDMKMVEELTMTSDEESTDALLALLDTSSTSSPGRPTFNASANTSRKRKKPSIKDFPSKKQKTDSMDGLPPLEKF